MAFCPGTALWRVRTGKGMRIRVGLVDGHEAMYGAANARTTGGGRGIYKNMN